MVDGSRISGLCGVRMRKPLAMMKAEHGEPIACTAYDGRGC